MPFKKKVLLFALLFCVITTNSFAQADFPIINKDILFKKIDEDKTGAKFFMVSIFVNYCHGRNDLDPNVKMVDSITQNKTRNFICQSSHGKSDRGAILAKVINDIGINKDMIYLIDDATYKPHSKDEREQGFEFRSDICLQCGFGPKSGTYYIVYNKNKVILFSGFLLNPEQMSAILTCEGK